LCEIHCISTDSGQRLDVRDHPIGVSVCPNAQCPSDRAQGALSRLRIDPHGSIGRQSRSRWRRLTRSSALFRRSLRTDSIRLGLSKAAGWRNSLALALMTWVISASLWWRSRRAAHVGTVRGGWELGAGSWEPGAGFGVQVADEALCSGCALLARLERWRGFAWSMPSPPRPRRGLEGVWSLPLGSLPSAQEWSGLGGRPSGERW
jgi:hypothetical protein